MSVSDGELSDDLSFELTVAEDLGSNFQLLYSETDDRAGSIPLSGAAVDGDLFARLHPEEGPAGEGIEEVRFYLDGAGSPFHDEGSAPYELQGGRNAARPWDTEKLDDGQHVIRTEVELDSGQVIAFDTDFVIANDVPPPPPGPEAPVLQAMGDQLLRVGENRELSLRATDANGDDISLAASGPAFVTFVDQGNGRGTLTLAPQAEDLGSHSLTITASDAALSSSLHIEIDVQEVPENEFQLVFSERNDRVGATPLHDATVDGDLFARVQPELGPDGQGIEEVRFYLDGADSHFHDEGSAPYELAGGRAATRPWDTEDLDDGSHSIRTEVELDDGQVISFDTVFTVANDAPPPVEPPAPPIEPPGESGGTERQLPTDAGEDELLRYPYAQQPSADELSILWATATGGNVQLNLRDGDGNLLREVAAETDHLTTGHTGMSDDLFLHRARLDSLPEDTEFLYEVSHDGVLMAQGLPLKSMPAVDAAAVEFLAFGDMGVDDDDARRVRDAMASRNPDGSYVYPRDFIVGLGDLAYTAGTHSEFDKNFFDQMSGKGSEVDEHAPDNGILLDRPFMTVLGNHEYDNDPATRPDGVLDSFAAPVMDGIPADDRERYYSFDVGPVHFLVLDTSKFEVESSVSRYDEMMTWADADLAASDQPWKVVFFHHSPFSYGKHGTYADISENRRMREEMVPVLQRHGVRAAFFGHDHMYSRTQPLKVVESGEDIGRIQRHEDDTIDHDGGIVFVGNGNGGKGLHNRTTNITTAGSNAWRYQRSSWGIGYDFVAWRNGEPVLFDDPDIGADDPLFPQWRKGFSHVRISAAGIEVTAYNSDGDVLDSFVIAP